MLSAVLDGTDSIDATTIRESERQLYQGRITCPDQSCKVPLLWRKRSRDGKSPTFYGNHADECDYKIETDEQIAAREIEEVNAIVNTSEELKIRLDAPGERRHNTRVIEGDTSARSRRHISHGRDEVKRTGSTGLRPLLRKLIADPGFRNSPMRLTLSDGTRTTIVAGCSHVESYQARDSTRIVWGKVKTTNVMTGWINAGYRDEKLPAVLVRKEVLPTVLAVASVPSLGDLGGWYFLVEERFGVTTVGTPYVSLQDAARIAFVPDPETT